MGFTLYKYIFIRKELLLNNQRHRGGIISAPRGINLPRSRIIFARWIELTEPPSYAGESASEGELRSELPEIINN